MFSEQKNKFFNRLFSRNTKFADCVRIRGKFCACFIKDISGFETTLIDRTLEILQSDVEAANSTSFSLSRDRDLLALAAFLLKHADALKAGLQGSLKLKLQL